MSGQVRAFNRRLHNGGVSYQFPECSIPAWLPPRPGHRLYQEYYLALEDDGTVRGGYILKWQDFWVGNRMVPVGYVHLPLSEGLIDRKFGALGLQLIMHASKRAPLLYALGIGSMEEPLAKMLGVLRWAVKPVPFFFKVLNPFRVAKGLTYLRKKPVTRALLDVGAYSGAAWVGLRLTQRGSVAAVEQVQVVDTLDDCADEVWRAARSAYRLVGCRDAPACALLYPQTGRFVRLKISAGGTVVGWVVLLDTEMRDHKYFGNLRVGSIVDGLARTEHAGAAVAAAVRWLTERGVDLIVSNQASADWGAALQRAGFLSGPSTFIFAASKALSQELHPFAENFPLAHLNRGDGDGPINL